MTTSRYQSSRALDCSNNRVRRSSCDDPQPGVVVANYTGVYVDRDMTPAEAAVLLLGMLGATYTDRLINALIAELEVRRK